MPPSLIYQPLTQIGQVAGPTLCKFRKERGGAVPKRTSFTSRKALLGLLRKTPSRIWRYSHASFLDITEPGCATSGRSGGSSPGSDRAPPVVVEKPFKGQEGTLRAFKESAFLDIYQAIYGSGRLQRAYIMQVPESTGGTSPKADVIRDQEGTLKAF